MDEIEIWTDGGCWPNPGKGAWAFAINKDEFKNGFEENTTNNRMEMTAIIQALVYAKHEFPMSYAVVISDSKYCVNGFNIWMVNWAKRKWSKQGGIKNIDLWKQLFELRDNAEMKWVKGHSGNDMNEFVDSLCKIENEPDWLKK